MGDFLDNIKGPADVRKLSTPQLEALAAEIRQFILTSLSKTGGHLASNLGVIELTLALHKAFDFKKDKLLWDVGHQCYTHKIITGRKDKFDSLRKVEGISGFPNPDESEYDQFLVGHAGTAVATAIGMALGQHHQKKEDNIVVVVGDASIVNGVSMEALNNLGLVKRQLLIVLNDNSMAIDATQGALAKTFSKIRLSHTYERLRDSADHFIERMPVIGKSAEEAVQRLKKSIRMTVPTSQLFESLNIPYFGPVSGHDIGSLVKLFQAANHLNHPAILHVFTKKGKGFAPAGAKPSKFHSTGPFKMNGDTVKAASERETFTNSFGKRLAELAQNDKKIVAITSAMCDGTGLMQFRKKFPERFYDVGIAESAAVDIAAGLAATGLKPIVCIYSTFLQRSFDQIFQEVALQNLPVVFCVDRAGLVGSDGPTHHGLMDIGFLRMMPNLVLIAPANDVEMKLALEFALSQAAPVVIRYPKDAVPPQKYVRAACSRPFVMGKSLTVKRSKDSKIAIVSYGSLLSEALEAAAMLAAERIPVDVINGRFAAPVDKKLVSLLDEGKGIITVEDHHLACGFGSALLESAAIESAAPKRKTKEAAKTKANNTIRLLGVPSAMIRHDSRDAQLMEVGVNADKIVRTAKQMLGIQPRSGKA